MRNRNKQLAVATAILAMIFGSMSAGASGGHDDRESRGTSGFTTKIIIGSIGAGQNYVLRPYRQPNYNQRAGGPYGFRDYRRYGVQCYRPYGPYHRQRRHDYRHRQDHYHGGHHGYGSYDH